MPVEVIGANDGVDALNETWPDGSEPVKQGDDHLRNIKKAIKNQERVNAANNYGAVNKNFLINADFSVWQRKNFNSGYGYAADRWMGMNSEVVRQWSVLEGPILKVTRLDADDAPLIVQPLELEVDGGSYSVKPLKLGGTYTLTARVNTTNKLKPFLYYGSDGQTATGAITDEVFTYQDRGSDGKVIFTFTVDNLPEQGDVCALIGFMGETKNIAVEFFDVKLEMGEVSTEFLPDDASVNWEKCQRFYQKGKDIIATAAVDANTARSVRSAILRFTTRMRVAPTVTATYNPGWFSATLSLIDETQFRVQGRADLAGSGTSVKDWIADAEF